MLCTVACLIVKGWDQNRGLLLANTSWIPRVELRPVCGQFATCLKVNSTTMFGIWLVASWFILYAIISTILISKKVNSAVFWSLKHASLFRRIISPQLQRANPWISIDWCKEPRIQTVYLLLVKKKSSFCILHNPGQPLHEIRPGNSATSKNMPLMCFDLIQF